MCGRFSMDGHAEVGDAFAGLLQFIAGHVPTRDAVDPLGEALHRELKEETGLKVAIENLVTVVDIIDRDDDGRVRYHYEVADYKCSNPVGTLKAGSDAADVKWVPLEKLKDYPLTPKAAEVIILAWKKQI